MQLGRKSRRLQLAAAVIMGITLSDHAAFGQDAAWEGLINAGRNALQQQDFSEAERHFEAALEVAESFPSGDARLGKSFNNLAAVYYAQEDYSRAGPLMRRALAQLRESLGPDDTEVAQTMKNMAALYYLQGNRSEAESLLKQALDILEHVHGPNHAFVATVLSNLAGLYQAENRYQDAEPLLTRSLAIWESLLGPDHPDVVRSRTLLAGVRRADRGGLSLRATAAESNPPAAATEADPTDAAATPAPTEDDPAPAAENQAAANDEVDQAAEALNQLTKEISEANVDATLSPDEGRGGKPPADAALGPVTTAQEETTVAILDEAASADDVSFSVYLSTLWSVDEARRYWQAIQTALPDVLQNKQMEIQEVTAAAGTDPFYRVLTFPFTSDPEAQAVCDEIRTQLRTHDCNVVVRDKTETTAGG